MTRPYPLTYCPIPPLQTIGSSLAVLLTLLITPYPVYGQATSAIINGYELAARVLDETAAALRPRPLLDEEKDEDEGQQKEQGINGVWVGGCVGGGACRPTCLPAHLRAFVCLSACLSVSLPVCLSACLPVCLSVCLSLCLSVCLSLCLSARTACVCVCERASVRVCVGERECVCACACAPPYHPNTAGTPPPPASLTPICPPLPAPTGQFSRVEPEMDGMVSSLVGCIRLMTDVRRVFSITLELPGVSSSHNMHLNRQNQRTMRRTMRRQRLQHRPSTLSPHLDPLGGTTSPGEVVLTLKPPAPLPCAKPGGWGLVQGLAVLWQMLLYEMQLLIMMATALM